MDDIIHHKRTSEYEYPGGGILEKDGMNVAKNIT